MLTFFVGAIALYLFFPLILSLLPYAVFIIGLILWADTGNAMFVIVPVGIIGAIFYYLANKPEEEIDEYF